jgi:hypothetical protein
MSRFSAEEQAARILADASADVRRHLATHEKGCPRSAIKADGTVDFEHGDLRPILAATASAYDIIVKVLNRIAALEGSKTESNRVLRDGGVVDDESRRVLRQAGLCGEDSLNDLDKWRLCQIRDELERVDDHEH